jgi:hypothetical protein
MAVLSDSDRAAITAEFQRVLENIEGLGITKAELRAFFNACDDWAEANATSFNQALPQPARSAMSLKQKSLGLAVTILKRAGLL